MKYLVLLILLSYAASTLAQTFEGKIIYNISYKNKMLGLSNEQLSAFMGTRQEYYIAGGNYKSVSNGNVIKYQLYVSEKNKSYFLTAASDTLFWEDYSIVNDKPVNYKIVENADTVLGNPCDLLIVEAEHSNTKFYYFLKYKVDADLYKKHNYGNWYFIISKTNSLPLKIVYENEQFISTSTAIEIKEMKLDKTFFEVPKNAIIVRAKW
jgi:hypothetical protein